MDEAIDPRPAVIADRLAGIRRIVAVTGSKGGIGKSVVAALIALEASDRGKAVGLLDLDFTSPSDHVVLGAAPTFPTETFGIDPHDVAGVDLVSVALIADDVPAPLRGTEATSALLELLAVVRWDTLDLLVLDMPPGLSDTSLDVLRLVPGAEFVLVAQSSRMVVDSVRRALRLLSELDVPIVGVIENMWRGDSGVVGELAAGHGIPFLGTVPYDPSLEAALGTPDRLRQTGVYQALARLRIG